MHRSTMSDDEKTHGSPVGSDPDGSPEGINNTVAVAGLPPDPDAHLSDAEREAIVGALWFISLQDSSLIFQY